MKNVDLWRPTKYIKKGSKLTASKNQNHIAPSSWLIAQINADFYSRYLKLYCKGDLLDLGCGNVPLYETYKDFITNVTCVDWAQNHPNHIHIDFIFDLTEPIPLDSSSYGTIILSDVLEHIPNPQNLWNEMSRLLKAEGNLIINTPFFYWIHEDPYDYYRYTVFALKRFAEIAKIEVLLLETIGGTPLVVADILAKNFVDMPKVGKAFAMLVQQFSYCFAKTSIGKRISETTKSKFPLGYFLIGKKIG
jgi:SAM-dependent methyltransferase